MFITNPEIFDLKYFELFDKDFSDLLQKNGFSLFGKIDDKYMFVKTEELSEFINAHKVELLKGGEQSGNE